MVRRLLPTTAWLLAGIAPALVLIVTGLDREYQYDLWHHLARGRAIVEQNRIVNEDLFTFTIPHQPFQDVNWLTQVFYFHLYRWGGFGLIQVVNSLVLAATLALVVHHCRRASGSLRLAGLLGAFTFLGLWQMLTIRPQTFSLFLFALLYELLDLSDRRRWLLVLPPFVLMLWVNLHGAFPIGLVLVGAFLAASAWEAWRERGWGVCRDRRTWLLGACLAASVLALLANPYGWRVYQYVGVTSGRASDRQIMEWMPPGLGLFIGKVWVVSLLVLIGAFGLSRRRPSARDLCLVVLFLPLACGAVRMVGWWFLVSAPIVAAQLAAGLPQSWLRAEEPERPSLVSGLSFGLLLALVGVSLPGVSRVLPFIPSKPYRTTPDLAAVADHLDSVPGAGKNVFAKYEWGEYLSWHLAPRGYKVFMDCRIEIYPAGLWDDYLAVNHGRADWEEVLDRYGATCLILDRWHTNQWKELEPQVQKSGRWQEEFRSGDVVLFVREEGSENTAGHRKLARVVAPGANAPGSP